MVLDNRQVELDGLLAEQAALPERIQAFAQDGDTKGITQTRWRAQELPHIIALVRVDLEKARLDYIKADYAEHDDRLHNLAIEHKEADRVFRDAQDWLDNATRNLHHEKHRYPVPLQKLVQNQEALIEQLTEEAAAVAVKAALSV